MKMKSVMLLVVAVACGLVAMLGVQQVLSGNKEEAANVTNVLVAIEEIPPGTPLDETNTIFKEMSQEMVPEGAVTDPDEIVEKSLKSAAVVNEIIMVAKLTTEFGASNEIPKGMRVVTTSVNLTKTHSGLIRAGDRVDIILSYKVRDPERGMIAKTRTVLEFIEIFATDSILANQDQGDSSEIDAKNLSFLVTPKQVAILKLAESMGDLNLALRHKHDDAPSEMISITELDLDDGLNGDRPETNPADDEGEPAPLLVDGGDNNVRVAIEKELVKPAATLNLETTEPDPKMWTVTIYSGDEVLKTEVPLPVDEFGMTEEEAAFAERETRLDEREAALEARESQLEEQNSPDDGTAGEDATKETAPEAGQTNPKSAEKENAKLWEGVLKRFLIGA